MAARASEALLAVTAAKTFLAAARRASLSTGGESTERGFGGAAATTMVSSSTGGRVLRWVGCLGGGGVRGRVFAAAAGRRPAPEQKWGEGSK